MEYLRLSLIKIKTDGPHSLFLLEKITYDPSVFICIVSEIISLNIYLGSALLKDT